jgi:prepilin-type N-terminal cleavage/methylation domain-containing protein
MHNKFLFKRGFTLIELLVVMAVIGVLASIVIVAVNPAEQLAKGRDASRISAITQIGNALGQYRAGNNGSSPPQGISWMEAFGTDLSGKPVNPSYVSGIGCNDVSTVGENNYCYKTSSAETIIYAQLEAKTANSKCISFPNTQAYYVFSSANARSCTVCSAPNIDPSAAAAVSCVAD